LIGYFFGIIFANGSQIFKKYKMKKLFTSLFVIFATMQMNAQTGNLVFCSEDGYPFKLVLNGEIQNEKPQTKVKVHNLNEASYKIKVIFDDPTLGAIDDKVNQRAYYEQTYVIKLKKISETEKSLKAAGQNAKGLFVTSKPTTDVVQTERWTIKMLSATPLQGPENAPAQTNTPQQMQNRPQSGQFQQAQPVQQTQTTTTTTTVKPGAANNNANMNIGMNMDGVGFGMNINVNENDNVDYHQSTTTSHTTTTTTTTNTAPQQQVYVVPGYSGSYGCAYPMSPAEFNDAKSSITSKSFEDSKFTLAKQICKSKCLLTSQVKDIMLLFTFEQTRLDFAKFAYGYTYDTGNYFKVNDAFTFETSIDDLNAYTGAGK